MVMNHYNKVPRGMENSLQADVFISKFYDFLEDTLG